MLPFLPASGSTADDHEETNELKIHKSEKRFLNNKKPHQPLSNVEINETIASVLSNFDEQNEKALKKGHKAENLMNGKVQEISLKVLCSTTKSEIGICSSGEIVCPNYNITGICSQTKKRCANTLFQGDDMRMRVEEKNIKGGLICFY